MCTEAVIVQVVAAVGGLLFVLLLAAAILRAGVNMANTVRGAKKRAVRPAADSDDAGGEQWADDRGPADEGGYPEPIPVPSVGRAMGVVLSSAVAQFGVGLFVVVPISAVLATAQVDPAAAQVVVQLISMPFGFLVTSSVLSRMLPTTFPRAMLVAAMSYVIGLLVIVVILGVPLAIMLVIRGPR